jgi:hypothetical protein
MNSIWSHRRLRFAVAATATILVGAALASAALAGIGALSLGPAAASQYPKKVTVCHRTHSKKHPWVKISISTHALKAHLRHGDFVVDATHPCPPNTPVSIGSAKNKNKNKHHGKHSGKGNAKGKSGKNSAQAKGNAKSGKNSAQAKGNAKSGKNSTQAKGNAKSGKNSTQAKGQGKSGKNSAQGKGNGKKNGAASTNDHPNNTGGNGHGNK